jgi:lipid II:glycine glycyltransferase (peptidoglycan interpeptide bridge formation enzyme)
LTSFAAVASSSAPALTCAAVTDRQCWEKLFGEAIAPQFTQAWCYGDGKLAEGWSLERLAFRSEGREVAICQVLIKRLLGVPLVARINRGPLFLSRAATPELQLAVLRLLRQRWRFARRGLLLIAPALPLDDASDALLRAAGFIHRRTGGWGSSQIDLEPAAEVIRASFSSKWRNPLNSAIRAGVEVRLRKNPDAFEWMLERHVDNMAAKGFEGPTPRFVRAMVAASPDTFWVLQAFLANEPVSALMGACLGAHAENFLGWTNDTGRRVGAHNLLIWHAILEMKAAGSRVLDLGGFTTRDKYGAYKRGLRGREYRLCGEWLAL